MKKELKELQKLELKTVEEQGFTKVNCPSCQTEIPAPNLDLSEKLAKCGACNAVFPFQNQLEKLFENTPKREAVPRPEGIDVIQFQDELDFTIEQPFPVFDLLGSIFFALFGFIFTAVYLKGKVTLIWPIVFIVLFAWTLFNMLTRSRNKIFLNINRHNLNIKWRPKKMMKDRNFDTQEIDQVYLKTDGTNYSLHLILNGIEGQKHVPLIHTIGISLAKARYIKQELENHLGIEPRKVLESNVKL